MSPRKICVVTGSRADYGLLFWLMKEIGGDPRLELKVAATGMHLSLQHGMTVQVIEADGFVVDHRVDIEVDRFGDSPASITRSMARGVAGFADLFEKDRPDIVVVLGDRYEIFAAAQAAVMTRIPVAHIHGGETTEGAIDEMIRHALTKMASLHFVSAEIHRERVLQMGEDPDRVFLTGAPGLDYLFKAKFLQKSELETEIDFRFGSMNFLVTFHPVTLGFRSSEDSMQAVLSALERFPNSHILFTSPNSDANSRVLVRLIGEFVARDPLRRKLVTSLGQLKYLSTIRAVDVVIGNSSSGLTEVPALKKPTVNIGDRQKGRLRSESVIDCEEEANSIARAIELAMTPAFKQVFTRKVSPYEDGNASFRIKEHLAHFELSHLTRKSFFLKSQVQG